MPSPQSASKRPCMQRLRCAGAQRGPSPWACRLVSPDLAHLWYELCCWALSWAVSLGGLPTR